jgi:DNA-binding helix-turn-helix protein
VVEALKQLRKSNKISQEEMARTLNISLRAYQLKEKGESELKLSELIILADKFNMSLTDFISRIV